VIRLADLQLLSRLRASGARLEQVVEFQVASVKASIGPMPELDPLQDLSRQRIRWSFGSESGSTTRIDIAIQIIVARAIRAKMPAPLQLDDLEPRRVVGDVQRTVALLRDLLLRRTGEEWSVRVGKGRHKERITIRSKPKTHVDGEMRMLDAALLAALTSRDFVNPASGIVIGATLRERTEMLGLISGNENPACDRKAAR
jgi:hypothetical protein